METFALLLVSSSSLVDSEVDNIADEIFILSLNPGK